MSDEETTAEERAELLRLLAKADSTLAEYNTWLAANPSPGDVTVPGWLGWAAKEHGEARLARAADVAYCDLAVNLAPRLVANVERAEALNVDLRTIIDSRGGTIALLMAQRDEAADERTVRAEREWQVALAESALAAERERISRYAEALREIRDKSAGSCPLGADVTYTECVAEGGVSDPGACSFHVASAALSDAPPAAPATPATKKPRRVALDANGHHDECECKQANRETDQQAREAVVRREALEEERLARRAAEAECERRGWLAAIEQAARVCWALADGLAGRNDMLTERGMAQQCAVEIRALARSRE